MLTPGEFAGRLAEWVAAFNRGSLDLPDRLLHRDATFRLNGTAYEDTLGRPATDPLVRLVSRGPGGYRLLARALQYALQRAEVAVRDFEITRGLATGYVDLSGVLRDTSELWRTSADLAMTVDVDGQVTELSFQIAGPSLERLRQARQA